MVSILLQRHLPHTNKLRVSLPVILIGPKMPSDILETLKSFPEARAIELNLRRNMSKEWCFSLRQPRKGENSASSLDEP